MARFAVCPKCGSPEIEINSMFGIIENGDGEAWGCWDCDWTESLNQEEKDDRDPGDGQEGK